MLSVGYLLLVHSELAHADQHRTAIQAPLDVPLGNFLSF